MGATNTNKIWDNIKEQVDKASTLKDINELLVRMHGSDAYVVIRDMFTSKTNRLVNECRTSSYKDLVAEYQTFQDIKLSAKQAWDHDRRLATNMDVDKAVSKAYGITLRMIAEINNAAGSKFIKVTDAINRIEEHLGMEITNFDEEENVDDTTESNDVQGVQEDIVGAGDTVTEA